MYDYIIRNGKIIDGTGSPWFIADVAIKGNDIVFIGKIKEEKVRKAEAEGCEIIDGAGKIVAPGFIDTHTHLDMAPFEFYTSQDPKSERRLRQGITTQVMGCCGISPAPVTDEGKLPWLERTFGLHQGEKAEWNSFGEYLNELDKRPLGVNYAGYVGHGAIRNCVMGYEDRKATAEEIEKMKELLVQAMEGGAVGISTGLIYAPGVFADTEELVELCAALKPYNGIYASHIRSENAGWVESVAEVIEICEKNQIPGIVHHLKTKAKESKKLVAEILGMIEEARERGVDVTFEQYPYEASATGLDVVLSSWMQEGGKEAVLARITDKENFVKYRDSIRKDYGWKDLEEEWIGSKNMLILSAEGHPEYVGHTVDVIAEKLDLTPIETVFKILVDTDIQSQGAFFGIKEEDICTILRNPYGMVGSDSDDCKIGETCHPRTNGTYPRVLREYVLDKKVIPIETAIFKMTGFPASKFGLHKRGLVKEGFCADLVMFDPEKLVNGPSYLEPFKEPEGMEIVFVNGVPALRENQPTGEMAGKVLRNK